MITKYHTDHIYHITHKYTGVKTKQLIFVNFFLVNMIRDIKQLYLVISNFPRVHPIATNIKQITGSLVKLTTFF